MSDNAERALALAAIGLHVFPCFESGERLRAPRTEHGFMEATTDPDVIRGWWGSHPESLIGVACGASGIVVMDVDVKGDKDGWEALKNASLIAAMTSTYMYETLSGGHHLVFSAPIDPPGPSVNHRLADGTQLVGVDRRSGGSYVVWWDEAWPDSRSEFAPAPDWFLNSVGSQGAAWSGTVQEWWETAGAGEMSPIMAAAAERISAGDFGRGELWTRMVHLIRLASRDGEHGAARALTRLHNEWLRPPWNTPRYQQEWRVSLTNAVQSNGGVLPQAEVALAEVDPLRDYDWFESTATLRHIRLWAYAQDLNPYAALLTVLARLSADIPPSVVIPSINGTPIGSLNFYGILAGPSGSGKSSLITGIDESLWPRPLTDPARMITPPSGEGIFRHYAETDSKGVQTWLASQALVTFDEVALVEAISSRSGNSLLPRLAQMWTGAATYSDAADKSRRVHLRPHSYRLAMLVGAQPGLGKVFFGDEAATLGVAQRFVYAHVLDPTLTVADLDKHTPHPGMLRREIHPQIPMPMDLRIPGTHEPRMGEQVFIPLDQTVVTELVRLRRMSKLPDAHGEVDRMRGHEAQVQLRTAALLGILHGEHGVTRHWFDVAEKVMAHSRATRDMLIAALTRKERAANRAQGAGDAERALAADAALERRCKTRVLELLREFNRKATRRDISVRLSARMRDVLPGVLDSLVREGQIQTESYPQRERTQGGEVWWLG